MKRQRIGLAAAAVLLAAGSAWAQGTGTASMYVDPPTIADPSIAVGQTIQVSVKCDLDFSNYLIAADFSIDYDPTVLEYVDRTLGDFFAGSGFEAGEQVPGHYWVCALSLGGWPEPVGTYTIITITFRVLKAGSTAITLTTPDDGIGADPPVPPLFIDDTNSVVFADPITGGSFSNEHPAVTVTDKLLAPATVGQPYSHAFGFVGGTGAATWSLSGHPTWLQIDPVTGVLSGMPTAAGNVPFTVMCTAGSSTSEALVLQVVGGATAAAGSGGGSGGGGCSAGAAHGGLAGLALAFVVLGGLLLRR